MTLPAGEGSCSAPERYSVLGTGLCRRHLVLPHRCSGSLALLAGCRRWVCQALLSGSFPPAMGPYNVADCSPGAALSAWARDASLVATGSSRLRPRLAEITVAPVGSPGSASQWSLLFQLGAMHPWNWSRPSALQPAPNGQLSRSAYRGTQQATRAPGDPGTLTTATAGRWRCRTGAAADSLGPGRQPGNFDPM